MKLVPCSSQKSLFARSGVDFTVNPPLPIIDRAAITMMSEGENKPLLRKPSGNNNSVHFSDTVEDSLRDRAIQSSQNRTLEHSSSSLSFVFQKLTRSERAEALQKEGVGGAAFLIRDAVLGNSNPAAGEKT